MKYIDLEMETIAFPVTDIITSSQNLTEWEKRQREDDLEADYDEYEGIEDADF